MLVLVVVVVVIVSISCSFSLSLWLAVFLWWRGFFLKAALSKSVKHQT